MILDHLIDIAQILLLHISGNKIAEPTGGQRPMPPKLPFSTASIEVTTIAELSFT